MKQTSVAVINAILEMSHIIAWLFMSPQSSALKINYVVDLVIYILKYMIKLGTEIHANSH